MNMDWIRDYGALALLAGGLSIYLVLLALNVLAGWHLPYPINMGLLIIAALPAAGIALLFQQVQEERSEQAQEDGEQE